MANKHRTMLKDGTAQVETRVVATAATDVVRVIAKNVKTDEQRAEVLAVWFESRAGQAMLRKLEDNLGLALVPVDMVIK